MFLFDRFFNKPPKTLILMIVASIILRFIIIFQNIDIIIEKLLCDDAFYYYAIAKNFIEGKGIVFNIGIPTNGFHPLYLILLLPLYLISPDQNIPIYLSLILLSIFSIMTSVYIYKIIHKILNSNKIGIFAAGIWLFSPNIIFLSLIGIEAPIQIFFISILTFFLIKWKNIIKYNIKQSVIIGFLCSVIFLSRLDGVFFIIVFLSLIIFRKLKVIFKEKKISYFYIKDILITVSLIIIICFPWILWSFLTTNSIFPVSGQAILLTNRRGWPSMILASLKYSLFFFWGTPFIDYSIFINTILGLFIFIFFIFLIKFDKEFLKKIIIKFNFLILTLILYYSYYIFYQRFIRWWYFSLIYFSLCLFVPIVLIRFYITLKKSNIDKNISLRKILLKINSIINIRKKLIIYGLTIFLLISLFTSTFILHYINGTNPNEKTKYIAALWIDQNLPENSKIGSFNTGIFQYYTKNFDIINLDGVVNYQACLSLKQGNIENYILEQNITYLIDPIKEISPLNFINYSLILIRTFQVASPILYLYKIVPNS
ncbi:MAG: hypothetical protein ACTSRP_21505 [Candidatus Helarchaeota archaeon]